MSGRSATRHTVFVVALVAVVVFPVAARAQDVNQILGNMRRAIAPAKDVRADFDMTMTTKRGDSTRWAGSYFRKGGADGGIHMIFESPLDLRGTEITARSDANGKEDFWIYLPALRRNRHIEGDMRGESFLGTDFNYEDLGLESLVNWTNTRVEDGKVDGHACYHVESKPPGGWWYGRVVRSIDKKTFLPLRTEYYDRSGVLWKVRTYDKIETVDGHPTATRITMQTIPENESTIIDLTRIQYDTGLSPKLFVAP